MMMELQHQRLMVLAEQLQLQLQLDSLICAGTVTTGSGARMELYGLPGASAS